MSDGNTTPDVPVTGTVVREYGTAFLRTTVLHHGGTRFVWIRRPGPGRRGLLPVPGPAVRAELQQVSRDGVRLLLGEPAPEAGRETGHAALYEANGGAPGERRRAPAGAENRTTPENRNGAGTAERLTYPTPGVFSAAHLLHSADPTATGLVVEALRATGATLRRLHARTWPDGTPSPGPPGPARLTAWLSGGPVPPAAEQLRSLLRTRLAPRLWDRLRTWSDDAVRQDCGTVLLHGAPSLGSLVPSPRSGQGVLLTGEEATGGHAAFDIGWLLGELTELRAAAQRGTGSAPAIDYAPAARALIDGYGAAPPPSSVARAAVLRIAAHMHDYASFVGWHDDLVVYADILAELLSTEGEAALSW